MGYLALPVPSGLGVREAVLLAGLPGLGGGSLLAASVAHRIPSFITETARAGASSLRLPGLDRPYSHRLDG